MTISETDWKTFKRLRQLALTRFCQRVLDDSNAICTDKSRSAHERYGDLYGLITKRNKEMANAFDDLRRSTAIFCLGLMVARGLLTEEELSEFSSEVERMARWE